ncbi:helix-turn-helix transcriptional regulator [Candidatus Poribacteria bacterium]|nr:helix-turn-helix transcriptional regulator [Candidatus Poribacteria bacterium]
MPDITCCSSPRGHVRKRRGFTQEALAEKASVSVNFIGNVERGESAISLKTLRQIGKVLGVNLKELFDFPDEEPSEILSEIVTSLNSREWEIDELKVVHQLIRLIAKR